MARPVKAAARTRRSYDSSRRQEQAVPAGAAVRGGVGWSLSNAALDRCELIVLQDAERAGLELELGSGLLHPERHSHIKNPYSRVF